MMTAQMLSSASSMAGTVADLAPGEKDSMRLLEAKAAEMAGGAAAPKPGNIMFVRGETQGNKKDKVVNPDEIDIDDDDDDEAEEEPEDVPVEKQNIPSEVFGSLKKTQEADDEDD